LEGGSRAHPGDEKNVQPEKSTTRDSKAPGEHSTRRTGSGVGRVFRLTVRQTLAKKLEPPADTTIEVNRHYIGRNLCREKEISATYMHLGEYEETRVTSRVKGRGLSQKTMIRGRGPGKREKSR